MFLVYTTKAFAKIKHWECNYLIINWHGGKETKYRGIYFLPDKKTLCIHGGGSTGSHDSFDFRVWHVMCGVGEEAEEFLLNTGLMDLM